MVKTAGVKSEEWRGWLRWIVFPRGKQCCFTLSNGDFWAVCHAETLWWWPHYEPVWCQDRWAQTVTKCSGNSVAKLRWVCHLLVLKVCSKVVWCYKALRDPKPRLGMASAFWTFWTEGKWRSARPLSHLHSPSSPFFFLSSDFHLETLLIHIKG